MSGCLLPRQIILVQFRQGLPDFRENMEATNSVKGSLKLRGGISLSKKRKKSKSKKSKKRKKDKEEPSSSSSGASAKVTSEDGDDRDAKKQRLTDTIVVEDTRTAAEKESSSFLFSKNRRAEGKKCCGLGGVRE